MSKKLERRLLRELMAHDPSHENRQLRERLTQTERDGHCIRRALFFLLVTCLLCLAGACYGALLAPDIFLHRRYDLLLGLGGVFAGSLFSLVVFLGLYVWKRSVICRLYQEIRHRFLALAEFSFKPRTQAERLQSALSEIRVAVPASEQEPLTTNKGIGRTGIPRPSIDEGECYRAFIE